MLVKGWPRHQWEHGRRSWSGLRSRPCGQCWHKDLRGGSPVADRSMRAHGVVVTAPALDDDLRLAQRVEDLAVEQLVAQSRIETLDKAVLPRTARRDVSGLRADRADHSCTALATNSGPLSERMCSGTPRRMNRSDSTSMTSIELSRRDARMPRHSCVNSSMMLSRRSLRPSWVRSSRKS